MFHYLETCPVPLQVEQVSVYVSFRIGTVHCTTPEPPQLEQSIVFSSVENVVFVLDIFSYLFNKKKYSFFAVNGKKW